MGVGESGQVGECGWVSGGAGLVGSTRVWGWGSGEQVSGGAGSVLGSGVSGGRVEGHVGQSYVP